MESRGAESPNTPKLHHSNTPTVLPVPRPPEGEAEKHQTAKVDAGNVAQLVNPARIVRSVNRRILPDQQSRQGHGHQGPVQHAESEAGHAVGFVEPGLGPAITESQEQSDQGQDRGFHHHFLHPRAWDAGGGLVWSGGRGGHAAKHVPESRLEASRLAEHPTFNIQHPTSNMTRHFASGWADRKSTRLNSSHLVIS